MEFTFNDGWMSVGELFKIQESRFGGRDDTNSFKTNMFFQNRLERFKVVRYIVRDEHEKYYWWGFLFLLK